MTRKVEITPEIQRLIVEAAQAVEKNKIVQELRKQAATRLTRVSVDATSQEDR